MDDNIFTLQVPTSKCFAFGIEYGLGGSIRAPAANQTSNHLFNSILEAVLKN